MSEDDRSEKRSSKEYRILPNHSAFFEILREADERARSMKLQSIELCIEDDDPTPDGSTSHCSAKLIQLDACWRTRIPEVLQQLAGGIYIDKRYLSKKGSLGEGGFAVVEKMELEWREGQKEMVAVKKLKPGVIEDDEDLRELVEESNLLRRVKHRGIVEFKGIGCFDETSVDTMRSSIFLAEEFMSGGSLKNLILDQMRSETKRLYWMEDAYRWLMQIAEALEYLHGCSPSVVHRDVKPENVLMSSKEWSTSVAKIADFGLHKRINRVHQIKRAKSSHLMEPVLNLLEQSRDKGLGQTKSESACIDIPKSTRPGATECRTDLSCYTLDMPSHFRIIKKSASLSGVHRDSPLWAVPEDSPLIDNDVGYHHLSSAYSVPQALISEDFTPVHLITPKQSWIEACSLEDAVDHNDNETDSEGDDSSASLETRVSEERVRGGQLGQLMGWIQTNSEKIASSKTRIPISLEPSKIDRGDHPLTRHFLFETEIKTKIEVQDSTEGKQHGSQSAFDQLNKLSIQPQRKLSNLKNRRHSRFSNRFALGLSGTESVTGIVGSLMYMAPEVYKGKHYNEKVDVFGFGLVMYELFLSELVIVRVLMEANRPGEMQSVLKKHTKAVAKGYREDIPYYWPEAVQNLIKDCWHQRPDQRPKMSQVVERLKEIKEAGCIADMDKRLARRIKKDPCCFPCIIA